MDNPSLFTAIGKLAIAGEEAGFSLEQMIQILDCRVQRRKSLAVDCSSA
jgi:hypothetical protein